jgi:hypothetical protein
LEDTSIILALSASDSDGDELTYGAATDAEANISINGSSITILPALNFNGDIHVTITVTDGQDSNNEDSQLFTLTVQAVNDAPSPFSIYPKLYKYNYSGMDTTAFYVENDSLYYFHLTQEMGLSLDAISLLRFAWEKNNELDADTNTDLNLGESFHLYYRLEAVVNNMFFIILRDSIDHDDDLFADSDSIFADINMTDEFVYYVDSYEDHLKNIITTFDTTGYTSYKWRVVAQNYQKDNLGHDPFQISSGFDSTDFRIDFIQPEVSNMDIILNDMYPGYYDLLWNSSEAFLTDSTFLSINEETNQFSAISMLNPRKITDNLFHFTEVKSVGITPVK